MRSPLDSDRDAARDHFFGELYYESTIDLLSERLTASEAGAISRLLGMREGKRYLDLGCGHGRHLRALADPEHGWVVGLDRSLSYLRMASAGGEGKGSGAGGVAMGSLVCGDIRALPFAAASFDGAYAWYSGLFLFDEPTNRLVLREIAKALRPGGLLLHQAANPHKLAAEPLARHAGTTRSGARVEEIATFDSSTGREHLHRRLTRADGSTLEGAWSVRHYDRSELQNVFSEAGFSLRGFHDEQGGGFDPQNSLSLVVLASKG